MSARRIQLDGQVQGVGFRPFVYRLAHQFELCGSVCNRSGQVDIFVQGPASQLASFEQDLIERAPAIAGPVIRSSEPIERFKADDFRILPSEAGGASAIHVPPDYFCCPDCLAELHDPADRRFGYAFINCTQCGPRYSLIEALPYDRPNTSMAGFPMCRACQAEYRDPVNRRFHAQPIACPDCGPALSYRTPRGSETGQVALPLMQAVQALRRGEIVAVKGIGGYHLMCDARNDVAVCRLRKRKQRPHKPLALMLASLAGAGPALDLFLDADEVQRMALRQVSRPIVLVGKRADSGLAESIAPGLNEIGVMLAYSPLHDLLLREFAGPLVATSGNLSGEPVITDNVMAEKRLSGIADAFLHHDRPIVRPADDSVLRIIAGQSRTLRAGRGMTPLEIDLPGMLDEPVLALGGHMKVTIALAWENKMVISPHIGEMGSPRSLAVFEQVLEDFQALYGVSATGLICDAHPGYASHKWAKSRGLPLSTIWHHHAHASMALLDTSFVDRAEPALVFTWDGVGMGPDVTLWGGEALIGKPGNWNRYAHWRPFNVPGGDLAGRAPWRSALALLWELQLDTPEFSGLGRDQLKLLEPAWKKRINAPQTTATGRLFDAAAALLGVTEWASFEGQGPMMLEAIAESANGEDMGLNVPGASGNGARVIDWAPLVQHMLDQSLSVNQRAADWHETLAGVILRLAQRARAEHGVLDIGLAGGVFQNRLLAERALSLLAAQGFSGHFPRRLPVNDGGLCAGQVNEYLHRSNK